MATDIGIDVGSYKTVIFSSSGIVLDSPSFVTVDSETFEPVYYGDKARQTLGRTPDSLLCVSPIEHGKISDYDIAESMLKVYMDEAFGSRIVKPRIMATLPSGLTELQHHSLTNAIESSGGRNIFILESPIAIAYGLDIDFSKPHGHLIIDIGAGTTDIAVLSLGGIAVSESSPVASFDFDNQIIKYVRSEYNIEIGPLTAESIKKQIGTVVERPVEIAMVAKGRNVFTGLPESFEITSSEVYFALKETAADICKAVRGVLAQTEPDLLADIKNDGFYLTGGGSQIFGMDTLLSEFIGAKVFMQEEPAYSVVKGAAAALRHSDSLKNINYQIRSIRELEIT